MRQRRVALVALLLTLLASSIFYISYGLRVYARYGAAYSGYTTACGSLIAWSPPQTVLTGFYPNMRSLVTIRYRSPIPEVTRLSVIIPGFTQTQTTESATAQGFHTAIFKPPLLSPKTLDTLTNAQQHAGQIDVRLTAGAQTLCDTSAPITLVSRQWIQWHNPGTGEDNTPMIAGWVTPDDATIRTLVGQTSVRLAAHPETYDGLTALFGYAQGAASPQQVRDQVNAIFDTLQFEDHLRYAADNPPFTQDATQRVQLPRDVLTSNAPVGMCVETTAIMASAIERLGMRPFIVFTPTHAFLGVALGPGSQAPIEYWETSDLNGGVDGSQANTHGDVEYAQDVASHSVQEIIDVQYERTHSIAPME